MMHFLCQSLYFHLECVRLFSKIFAAMRDVLFLPLRCAKCSKKSFSINLENLLSLLELEQNKMLKNLDLVLEKLKSDFLEIIFRWLLLNVIGSSHEFWVHPIT